MKSIICNYELDKIKYTLMLNKIVLCNNIRYNNHIRNINDGLNIIASIKEHIKSMDELIKDKEEKLQILKKRLEVLEEVM